VASAAGTLPIGADATVVFAPTDAATNSVRAASRRASSAAVIAKTRGSSASAPVQPAGGADQGTLGHRRRVPGLIDRGPLEERCGGRVVEAREPVLHPANGRCASDCTPSP
jgi:hypothetical protein